MARVQKADPSWVELHVCNYFLANQLIAALEERFGKLKWEFKRFDCGSAVSVVYWTNADDFEDKEGDLSYLRGLVWGFLAGRAKAYAQVSKFIDDNK